MKAESGGVIAEKCANHPNVETYLKCSRCGKPICPDCVIPTPVGGRCRECAQLRRPPTFQVGAGRYSKALLYGVAAAVVAGYLWGRVGSAFGLSWMLLLLVGYVVGEAASRGADRRVSGGLVVMAGALTVFAAVFGRSAAVFEKLPSGLPLGVRLEMAISLGVGGLFSGLFVLLLLVLAVVIATSRIR